MPKTDYSSWSKEDLIKKIKALEKRKKYGLVWDSAREPEKVVLDCQKELPVLKEISKNEILTLTSKDDVTHILIEGDNYHALSVLSYTHEKAVDLIYIDPPYNTGNGDFVYNDRFIDSEDPYKHTKWLTFMEKRLRLARNILKPSGVIFISIDNNEQAQLKLLCDEIFNENNFIGNFIWRKKEGGGQADSYFVTEHEYILVYAKSNEFRWLDELIPIDETQYNKEDVNGKFTAVKLAKWGNTARREDRPKMYFPIKSPDGKNVNPVAPDGGEGRWRVGKKTMDILIQKDLIYWQHSKGRWIPYEKIYYSNEQVKKVKQRSILFEIATTADGTNELTAIFGKKDVFENPKPTELIKFFIRYGANESAIVVDFFAGSGTTAHAVLSLNKEDRGNRQFILCTDNENNICTDVCYPRVKKVISGFTSLKGTVQGLGGNLKYYTTSFVPASPTDKNKELLTMQSIEMLTLKEGTFEKVTENPSYVIYRNSDKYTGIIFDQLCFSEFKKAVANVNKPISLYIFSLTDHDFSDDFTDVKGLIKICAIPEAILRVYRRIFR
jgi:adenine-specific DNA-methyltransferase